MWYIPILGDGVHPSNSLLWQGDDSWPPMGVQEFFVFRRNEAVGAIGQYIGRGAYERWKAIERTAQGVGAVREPPSTSGLSEPRLRWFQSEGVVDAAGAGGGFARRGRRD